MSILDVLAGVVTSVRGEAFVRSPEGELVPLKVGDRVEAGQLVLSASGDVLETIAAPQVQTSAAAADLDQIISSLDQAEITEDAPAAGLAGGDGGLLGPGLRVDRVLEEVGPQAFGGESLEENDASQLEAGPLTDQRQLGGTVGGDPLPPDPEPRPPVVDPQPPEPPNPGLLPSLVIDGVAATEGDPVVFNVRLTQPPTGPVTVNLELVPGTESGDAARPGLDTLTDLEFRLGDTGPWSPVNGGVTFPAGSTLVQVRVATIDDGAVESTEYIGLRATVVAGQTANTVASNDTAITDDDKPFLVVYGAGENTVEGGYAEFTVNLTQASPEPVTVRLGLLAGSDPANPAQPDVDTTGPLEYFNVDTQQWETVSGDLTLAAGQTEIQVRVATVDDAAVEGLEFIQLQATVISGDTANTVASNDKAITDNDKPYLVVYGAGENTVEGGYAAFTVNLTQASPEPVTVRLGLLAGSDPANPAQPDVDTTGPLEYFNVDTQQWETVSGDLTLAAGQTEIQVRVATVDDADIEGLEFIQLQATVISGETVNTVASNDKAITDNDKPYMVVYSNDAIEGQYAYYSVNLTSATNETVSVVLASQAGGSAAESAQPGIDASNELEFFNNVTQQWELVSGPLSFLPGDTRIDVRVSITDDAEVESVEYLRLQATVVEGSVVNPVTWNDVAITDNEGRIVIGSSGDDELLGQAGNDALQGLAGSDLLYGGRGDDALNGGEGSDVFAWTLTDVVDGVTTVDRIEDFSLLPPSEGGDVLDLRDLLQGENTEGGIGNLTQFLRFDTSGPDTVIQINVAGDLDSTPDVVNQQIVLEGINLRAEYGLDSSAGDAALIARMLADQKLLVDAA